VPNLDNLYRSPTHTSALGITKIEDGYVFEVITSLGGDTPAQAKGAVFLGTETVQWMIEDLLKGITES